MEARRKPPPAIHPGKHLRKKLDAAGWPAAQCAARLGVPVNRVTQILKGERGITADTALRLARLFGGAPESWMSLQAAHDLWRAEQKSGWRIARSVRPSGRKADKR